jgi:hypothetical protein
LVAQSSEQLSKKKQRGEPNQKKKDMDTSNKSIEQKPPIKIKAAKRGVYKLREKVR